MQFNRLLSIFALVKASFISMMAKYVSIPYSITIEKNSMVSRVLCDFIHLFFKSEINRYMNKVIKDTLNIMQKYILFSA